MNLNHPLRVLALGRDVKVGDLYNYYTSIICPSSGAVSNEDYKELRIKRQSLVEIVNTIIPNRSDFSVFSVMGINSHLNRCIEKGNLKVDQLWFANYLKNSKQQVHNNQVEVVVYLRIIRSIETIGEELLNKKICENQLISDGQSTHLVNQLVLGAELIILLQKDVDLSQETQDEAKNSVYVAACLYFNQVTALNSISTDELPLELDNVSCVIYSSLEPDIIIMEKCFRHSCKLLKKIISDENQNCKWRPIYIDLLSIPFQMEFRILIDQNNDQLSIIKQNWSCILQESQRLIHSTSRIPQMEKALCQFENLLKSLWSETFPGLFEPNNPLLVSQSVIQMSNLLSRVLGWLSQRREEIEKINSSLKHNQQAMVEFLEKTKNNNQVAVWNYDFVPDPLAEEIQKLVGHQGPAFKLPVFRAIDKEELKEPEIQHQNSQESEYEFIQVDITANESSNISDMLEKSFTNRRTAEVFAEENSKYCKLIKQGHPNVYLLNAVEHSVGNGICWYDVGNPKAVPDLQDNHKVILLMGATGCGKSTLINGMINYILGVQWKDPFRFKIIREEHGRNQAYSQTSVVTAYNLLYHTGMTIPYSITIIDTPGYGDTRGVERDKEITQIIHRFLTQPETQIDQIHAVCFVAASGDSRLTTTQRYILDSVLATFGKDVKNNIRLLVTFADNADPPVVEACKAAHFPTTGIMYSKFNSSVLYVQNEEEDDFSFDELFWDMGQENFQKFFEMLEAMDGCDLTSTREVIQRRQRLEQSLKDIEVELDICLDNIENMEKLQREIRQHGHLMDKNKDFVIEIKEMRSMRMDCKKGWKAYNCRRCQKTCEGPRKLWFFNKCQDGRKCKNEMCQCPGTEHEYQQFQWRSEVVPVKKILHEIKAEFQLNSKQKMKTEDLLEKCSYELNLAKAKVFSLLDQIGENSRSLDSTALRSNVLNPAEYLSLMRSRINEEKAPGYLTRLETLSELQRSLSADTTTCHKTNICQSPRLVASSGAHGCSKPHWHPTSKSPGFGRGYPTRSNSPKYYSTVESSTTGHVVIAGFGDRQLHNDNVSKTTDETSPVKETSKSTGIIGFIKTNFFP